MKLLDLYCKAGGAADGYTRAGFDVTGVDIEPQKNYPYKFIQGDAIEVLKRIGHKYDFIHSSPPCQLFSKSTSFLKRNGKEYPDLIEATRMAILKTGKPGVIENVTQAPVRPDVVLYGYYFGLKVIRKRVFECVNWYMLNPCPAKKVGEVMKGDFVSVYGSAKWNNTSWGNKKFDKDSIKFKKNTIRETWAYAMGFDEGRYITDRELSESIPPAYTHFIGSQFLLQHT